MTQQAAPSQPIGVFDSGVGGLSVLKALYAELPNERFVYVADNAHAPYGERDDSHVQARSHAITDYLVAQHGIKALVVACNTATAAAIRKLREAYPSLLIVGIEPALKPAAAQTRTGVVAVMATRSTLNSEKFKGLFDSLHHQVQFKLQPCDGLADAIERGDAARTEALCTTYTQALGPFGTQAGQADVLVLGCTHYPFVAPLLERLVGPETPMLEGGIPVARQTRRLLQDCGLLASPATAPQLPAHTYYSTGDMALLQGALARWLERDTGVGPLAV